MHSTRLDSARKRAESVDSLSSRRPEHSLSENLHGRIGEHRNNTQQTVWVCDDAMRHGVALMPLLMRGAYMSVMNMPSGFSETHHPA
jgi:hypothetical protein